MKIALFAAAATAAIGLAACQPAAKETPATAADTAAANTSSMAPAEPSSEAMAPDPMASAPNAIPPANGMSGTSGTMNPDGSMSNGAVNPASPPPVTAPDTMGSTPPSR